MRPCRICPRRETAMPGTTTRRRRFDDSGQTIYLVAAGLVFLLGTCGLAIDLVTLYSGRSEAQRAADAAALAGASVFITSGCTGGASGTSCSSTSVESAAATSAAAAGNLNLIGGNSPSMNATVSASCPPTSASDVCFPADPT